MTGGRLRVLTYHRVLAGALPRTWDPSTVSATLSVFEAQVRHLHQRYNVVSALDVIAACRTGRRLPPRAVLVTFDDAGRDFSSVAWPVLRARGMSATVFVPTAFPNRPERAFWWDRLHAALRDTTQEHFDDPRLGRMLLHTPAARHTSLRLAQGHLKRMPHEDAMAVVERLCGALGESTPPAGECLTWAELRRLESEGVVIGAHTRTHPALTQLPPSEARKEIEGCRDDLRRELGTDARVFAYPFGDHADDVVELVRNAGFDLAVTCLDGHNGPDDDPLRLRRTNISRRTTPPVFRVRMTRPGAWVDQWRHRRGRARPVPSARARTAVPLKVGYIMSRFPKLSETFILNEMQAVASLGIPVDIYPLLRARQATTHPEAVAWMRKAHFHPLVSAGVLRAHLHFLAHSPATYVATGVDVLRRTWGGRKLFVGALGTFPRAVRFAYDMRRAAVTHVHAHFATHPALAAYVIHRLTGLPYSFTAHGSDLHVDRRMLDVKVKAAAFAVTVSRFNKEVMVQACGESSRDKIHVVHCGVDAKAFAPTVRPATPHTLRIVCVASLELVKGHAFLVEACRLLAARGLRLRCDLIGDGPLRRRIEQQIADAGLAGHVHLLGGRPRPEVIALLAAADVAVLASHPTRDGRREGIPVALMEAMACGLPVVASAISGIPELVDDEVTGLLVASGNPAALAVAIERLHADPALRARLGHAGRAKVLREFDLEHSTRQLLHLIGLPDARAVAPAPSATVLAHCS
jgi:colanic acid/amylovoran biosynthesis glycosyltransferase